MGMLKKYHHRGTEDTEGIIQPAGAGKEIKIFEPMTDRGREYTKRKKYFTQRDKGVMLEGLSFFRPIGISRSGKRWITLCSLCLCGEENRGIIRRKHLNATC